MRKRRQLNQVFPILKTMQLTKYQIKSITSGESFISANSLNLNFGLGSANKIEEISINWPNGGKKVITNVDSNQFLTIYED